MSSVLPKLLRCVSWSVAEQRKVAESLLAKWVLLEPEHALQVGPGPCVCVCRAALPCGAPSRARRGFPSLHAEPAPFPTVPVPRPPPPPTLTP